MAKKRNSAHQLGGNDIIAPTPERFFHGVVEQLERPIADDAGRPARPYRNIDVLAVMERRGSITPQMREAGEQFRSDFTRAHLDPLRAGDMVRTVYGTGSCQEPGLSAERARNAIWRAICAVGGLASPAGSALWHVAGYERTLKEWAFEQGWNGRSVSQEAASGIFIAALGMIAAHYDRRRDTQPPPGRISPGPYIPSNGHFRVLEL